MVAQHRFYAEALRAHLGSLATGHGLGTICVVQTRSLRSGRCRKNLPLGDLSLSLGHAIARHIRSRTTPLRDAFTASPFPLGR